MGSTATLVVERFRSHGREPQRPTATMLLAAILSDTVILSSPTTTDARPPVVAYLEELLSLDARDFGTEMFEASSDVGDVPAADIVRRDAKEYEVRNGRRLCVAQIETVGRGLLARRTELLGAMEDVRGAPMDYVLMALMVTDIVGKGTELLVAGDLATRGARVRRAGRGRRARPARRHEPQEAGRAEGAVGLLAVGHPEAVLGAADGVLGGDAGHVVVAGLGEGGLGALERGLGALAVDLVGALGLLDQHLDPVLLHRDVALAGGEDELACRRAA